MTNIDNETVESFGAEWSHFSQSDLSPEELETLFNHYFHIFPWDRLPKDAVGFDMGCGSGRWASLVAPRVGRLNCIDPAEAALDVARQNLARCSNVRFIHAGVSESMLERGSQDFGYSLGVLHHIPDTAAALASCVEFLKPGAPFLLYLYYRFDNKPVWYYRMWQASNAIRVVVSKLPDRVKTLATDPIAVGVYLPLARISKIGARLGLNVQNWPLSSYRDTSVYTMRTDSRDRFGTPLEQRFTRAEIESMMMRAGLENIVFSDRFPFWCAVGTKRSPSGRAQ